VQPSPKLPSIKHSQPSENWAQHCPQEDNVGIFLRIDVTYFSEMHTRGLFACVNKVGSHPESAGLEDAGKLFAPVLNAAAACSRGTRDRVNHALGLTRSPSTAR
jgi:hypothetical protein